MSVWFSSDLHLGNTRSRGIGSSEQTANRIVVNINSMVNKGDKLFLLGDVADTYEGLKCINKIRCANIELILGNHDKFQLTKYHQAGIKKIHGFRGYKNYWLSHCPIHPNEMRKKIANIHGHIHRDGDTEKITDSRYFNVNTEFHEFYPVSMDNINKYYNQ